MIPNTAKETLKKKESKAARMASQSPDLNPIENKNSEFIEEATEHSRCASIHATSVSIQKASWSCHFQQRLLYKVLNKFQ